MSVGAGRARVVWGVALAACLALVLLLLADREPRPDGPQDGTAVRASAVTEEPIGAFGVPGEVSAGIEAKPPLDAAWSAAEPEPLAAEAAGESGSALAVLRGRVVNETGDGIPGAEIWLSDKGEWHAGRVVARTDASGRFELPGAHESQYVAAIAAGFVPSARNRVLERHARELLDLVVSTPCGRVLFRVSDGSGTPVAGAHIVLGSAEGWPLTQEPTEGVYLGPPAQQQVTNAEGVARFDGIPTGLAPLQVAAAGFAPFERAQVPVRSATPAELDITLQPECVVEGVVRDAAGRPVAGVQVRRVEFRAAVGRAGTSDADGAYRLGELPAGRVTLEASHAEAGELRHDVTCKPGVTGEWNPVLEPGALLQGVVVDRRGSPLARASVALEEEGDDLRAQSALTDEHGAFTIRRLRGGAFGLMVTAEGVRLPALILHDQGNWAGVRTLIAGWALGAGNVLKGTLERGSAGPEPSLRVLLVPNATGPSPPAAVAMPGPDGRFELRDIPDGSYAFLVQIGGQWLQYVELELEGGRTLDLGTLVVDVALGALVLHPRFEGFEGAPPDAPFVSAKLLRADGSHLGWVLQRGTAFTRAAMRAGDYLVELQCEGMATTRLPVKITAGSTTELDVSLVPGQWVALRGESYPTETNCEVQVLDARDRVVSADTIRISGDGKFHHSASLAPGTYRLEVRVNGELLHAAPFDVTDEPDQRVQLNGPGP